MHKTSLHKAHFSDTLKLRYLDGEKKEEMKTGRKEIFTRAPSKLTNRQVGDTTKQQLPPPHASSCICGSLAMASCLLKLKSSKQDCNVEWNSYWALQVSKEVTWNWISAEFPRWDLKNWSDPVILLNILYFFMLKKCLDINYHFTCEIPERQLALQHHCQRQPFKLPR